jgi:hypothetical protein
LFHATCDKLERQLPENHLRQSGWFHDAVFSGPGLGLVRQIVERVGRKFKQIFYILLHCSLAHFMNSAMIFWLNLGLMEVT